jgi:cytochrome c556
VSETPGQAAQRVWEATGNWDDVAKAAMNAAVNSLLSATGVTLDEVITAVTAIVPEEPAS